MNPFSKDYKPQIKLKATPRETQLHAANKAQRQAIALASPKNQISIATPAQSDESKRKAGRAINHV